MVPRVLVAVVLGLTGCDKLLDLRVVPPVPTVDATDAFMPVIGCSPISMLAADFDTGGTDLLPLLLGLPDTNTATFSGGALVVNMFSVGYFTVSSGFHYDLRDNQFTIEVTDDGGVGAGNDFVVELAGRRTGYQLWFVREGGDLSLKRTDAGMPFEVDRLPYDPVAHRFLRFAHRGGVTTWETSPTGGDDFVVRASVPGLDWVDYTAFRLGATRNGNEFKVMIHSLNGGTPMGDACPVAQLSDDFAASALDLQWSNTTAYGGTLTQAAGALTFALSTTDYNNITLRPSIRYDLRGGAFAVEIPQMLDVSTDQSLALAIETLDLSYYQLEQSMGTLSAFRPTGSVANSAPYSPTAHRWWRVRESMGTLYWDVSADGVSYTNFAQISNVTGLDSVSPRVNALGVATAPSAATLDNVNR